MLSHLLKQGLLSQRQCDASCPSAVSFNSTIRYPEHSLLLLVTLASDLPMHTTKFCSVVFGVMSRLSVINNITDARRFVIHLLWSTSAATYCYKWWVSSTCHSPVALCLQQLMVTSLTTCNYAIWCSKTVIPPALDIPLGGTSLNAATTFGMEKPEWCIYRWWKIFEDMTTRYDTQCMNVTDSKTDGRTDRHCTTA